MQDNASRNQSFKKMHNITLIPITREKQEVSLSRSLLHFFHEQS